MHPTRKQLFTAIITLLLSLNCISGFNGSSKPADEEFEFAWKFLDLFFIFRDRLPQNPYSFDSAQQLYASVEEPFTVYYSPEDAAEMSDVLTTSSAGLGVRLDSVQSGFVILDVFPNSPAQQAGLQENDTIIAVDGVSVEDVSFEQFSSLVQGQVGDTKKITVKRGSEEIDISVTLDTFLAPSVFTDSLDEEIAYIFITSFFSQTAVAGGTAQEFSLALEQTQWAQTTIIDLRNNPGGEVEQVIPVISQFIPANTPIVNSTERRPVLGTEQAQTVDSTWVTIETENLAINREFILLMNESTASASEIMIAALMEHRPEIPTVGTTTFGKARGQAMAITPDSGLAIVTFALLEPINGESYDMEGIEPQIRAEGSEDPLDIALEIARRNLGKLSHTCTASALRRTKMYHYTFRVHNRFPMTIIAK